ncbi:MAG: A/G-specific adenine glycosylase [Candidatus Pacebacteria bacterium]|nr:A/G-specific adenine glycosylase [Candidatus Paceibacterota bacterium]
MDRFIRIVWKHYAAHKRDMPWRADTRPYYVVVSEIMLQQTQVDRVMRKFDSFIARFPDWQTLAQASTRDVLQEWSGLGYNRRALYLKKIAEIITDNGKPSGTLPQTYDELRKLPGIGPNTAGSILAFAYNIPHPFIETNIRSVFIHFFFSEIEKREGKKACKKISDEQIMPFIEKALSDPRNAKNPREWHYALMDYGALLKKTLPNPSRRSAHHVTQKPFKGSNRELRSRILKLVMEKPVKTTEIFAHFKKRKSNQEKIHKNIDDLINEGFITQKSNGILVIVS